MESSGSSTNTASKALFRFIEVSWCAVFIVVPPIWYVIFAAILIQKALVSGDEVGRELGGVTLYLIIIIAIEIYYGVAFARFVHRLIPSHPSEIDPAKQGLRLFFVAACLSPLIVLFSILIPSAQIALTISSAAWLACVLIPLYLADRKLKRLFQGRFILFLRRFSTFADRAVIGLVFSQALPDKPIVVLTPNKSGSGDWNPYLVGFAGLKIRAPIVSMPILLRAPDTNWELPAKTLIDKAHLLVLDISDSSTAIQTEMLMIERASRWRDTICIRDGDVTRNPDLDNFILGKGGWLISYKRNWGQIVPRLLIFLVASVLGFVQVSSVITQRYRPTSELETAVATLIALIIWGVPFLSGFGLLIYSTFIFPSIALSAKPAVRRALRNVPSDERLIRTFHQNYGNFERLVAMSLEDVTKAAPASLYVVPANVTSDTDLTLSPQRRDQYLRVFQLLGVNYGLRFHSKDFIHLAAINTIAGRHGCEKGYVYTSNELSPLYDSLDIQSARGRYLFRRLKANWYLYLYEK